MSLNPEKPLESQSISAKPSVRKIEADRIPKIDIQDLNRKGLFQSEKGGHVTWRDPYTQSEIYFSVYIMVDSDEGKPEIGYIEFSWPKQNAINYKDRNYGSATFITTPGRFGGKRYWFKCTQPKCRRRVAVLYLLDNHLACLTCHNLTYKSRNLSGKKKKLGRVIPIPEIERLGKAVKRFQYRGEPTKRFQSFIKKRDRSMKAFEHNLDKLEEKIKDAQDKFKE
jgi:hypothetical protein